MSLWRRLEAWDTARYEAEQRAEAEQSEMVDVCPACDHSRDEMERNDSDWLGQWWRRVRGKRLRPAICHATAGMPHVITPCRCRHAFHGS